MAIKVLLTSVFQKLASGKSEISLDGVYNVSSLIEKLELEYPGFKERLYDENGALRRFINIFVNGEDIRFLEGEKTEIRDNSEVSIIPAISGG